MDTLKETADPTSDRISKVCPKISPITEENSTHPCLACTTLIRNSKDSTNTEEVQGVYFTFSDVSNKQDTEWKKSDYCVDCTNHLIQTLWEKYIEDLLKANCERELRGLITAGPPKRFRDIHLTENREVTLFKTDEDEEFSSTLANSPSVEKINKMSTRLNELLTVLDAHKKEDVDSSKLMDIMTEVKNIVENTVD
ncbi:hypothetical protein YASMINEVIRUS_1538 [Yasminevirus sp. GU-2018]|uniref:Uncharacterized protein n=1 Tax=Yasminevirus sp. GU-2018 TaxID=2420051 RepID=A0A5K0UC96_9VIRU|nr:hypothetical protein YASMINEVIRUS_1538 [Yasminevirus sp. GU-2018]